MFTKDDVPRYRRQLKLRVAVHVRVYISSIYRYMSTFIDACSIFN